jgi:hypothetical protein
MVNTPWSNNVIRLQSRHSSPPSSKVECTPQAQPRIPITALERTCQGYLWVAKIL